MNHSYVVSQIKSQQELHSKLLEAVPNFLLDLLPPVTIGCSDERQNDQQSQKEQRLHKDKRGRSVTQGCVQGSAQRSQSTPHPNLRKTEHDHREPQQANQKHASCREA